MRRRAARSSGWMPAVLYALALHGTIIALLVIGFRVVSRDEARAPVMQAVVVREPSPEQEKADEQARKEEERKQREAEQQRVAEEQQRQEVERKKLEEEKKREETERKKKEEVAEKKRDEERKKAEKQRRQQAEQALREQLEEEEKARAAARTAKRAPEAKKFEAAIQQKIERNWARPSGGRKGLLCTIRVRLAAGGEVLQTTIVRSSGDPVFDRSVENAVLKASPLPVPDDPELFNEYFREFDVIPPREG